MDGGIMAMDIDRLDADPYQSIEFDELDDYADAQRGIAPILDKDDVEVDEHSADFLPSNIYIPSMMEEIWFDSAPPEHFTIETGYLN
jgi:predicted exporter